MNRIVKSDTSRGRIAVVGMWDGVHSGHRFLIDYLKVEARYRSLTPSVITFDVHPLSVVRPLETPLLINTYDERMLRLENAGVDDCIILEFTDRMRRMTAREFLTMLNRKYAVKALVVGFNNRFGHDRTEGVDRYREIAREMDMEIIEAPEFKGKGSPVSSSVIRNLITDGKIEEASRLLGYDFSIRGIVTDGNKLGRTLGFPTANIDLKGETLLIPAPGVYAAWVKTPDGVDRMAMVNVGYRPTVTDEPVRLSVEAHIIDFSGYIYGEEIEIRFISRLRNEKKFSTVEKLRSRLESDARQVRELLSAKKS